MNSDADVVHPSQAATLSTSAPTAASTSSPLPHYSLLAVGILTSDVVLDCAYYPAEDESVRAANRYIRPGGNATNTLRVFAQLAASPPSLRRMTVSSSLLASLGSSDTTAALLDGLHAYGIDTAGCPVYEGHPLPTSYIISSQCSGSRTIVHHRGELPELSVADFSALSASHTLYHFEGRSNTADLLAIITALTQRQQKLHAVVSPFSRWPLVSLEVEKPRDNIHSLLHLPNLLILSRDYALALHPTTTATPTTPAAYLATLPPTSPLLPQPAHQLMVLCWGDMGAAVRFSDGRVLASAAEHVGTVVDSVGAGDSFIAGLLYGVLGCRAQLVAAATAAAVVREDARMVEESGTECVERLVGFANSVAAAKCRVSGIDLPGSVVEQLLTQLYCPR